MYIYTELVKFTGLVYNNYSIQWLRKPWFIIHACFNIHAKVKHACENSRTKHVCMYICIICISICMHACMYLLVSLISFYSNFCFRSAIFKLLPQTIIHNKLYHVTLIFICNCLSLLLEHFLN